ncbi:nucleotide-diphospho-sugar transferase [Peziza echinospora]|nr:nucleotide-diphospho-sugar transferase [Peziza echinospora]
MVLSHALRDGGVRNGVQVPGTTKKLAVLVAEGRLSRQSLDELALRYDYVIPVPVISGNAPANLALLGRPELNETFTKINLWKQTQFRKIVYLDADVLPISPPDELFDTEAVFAASPDIGWPDCFNSGVFVLTPSKETYQSLLQLATTGQSFDGADQGLLNTYFEDWHRLPFTYNTTPSASYQYTPAYRHFGGKVSVVHFIGPNKPWNSRKATHTGGPFDEHANTWWTVWDRHYVPQGSGSAANLSTYKAPQGSKSTPAQDSSSQSSATEVAPASWNPPPKVTEASGSNTAPTNTAAPEASDAAASDPAEDRSATPTPIAIQPPAPAVQAVKQSEYDEYRAFQPTFIVAGTVYVHRSEDFDEEDLNAYEKAYPLSSAPSYVEPFKAPHYEWDPARSPPPTNSAPEASNLPYQIMYRNEWDLIADALKNKSTSGRVRSRLQGETKISGNVKAQEPVQEQAPVSTLPEGLKPVFPWELRPYAATRVFSDTPVDRVFSPELDSETDDDTTVSYDEPESEFSDAEEENVNSWRDYGSNGNQWDAIPGISKYVSSLQHHSPHFKPNSSGYTKQNSSILTDVTGRRINRRSGAVKNYPSAPGIPPQDQWDPNAKLNDLRTLPVSFLERQARRETSGGHGQQ